MSDIPLREFLDLLTRGIVQPRPVARRLIDARPSRPERFTLVGLAAAMQGGFWAGMSAIAPGLTGGLSGLGLGGQLMLAAFLFINYVVTATVAYNLGARFGGRGSPAEVATAVAWQTVLGAALTPVQVLALGAATPGQVGAGSALFALLYGALNIYLLSACVAEAHGFPSTGRVAAAVVAIFLGLGFAFSLLLAALAPA